MAAMGEQDQKGKGWPHRAVTLIPDATELGPGDAGESQGKVHPGQSSQSPQQANVHCDPPRKG